VALRQRISIGALVLFEPVALRILPVVGEVAAYEAAKAMFDDYLACFEGGDHRAIRTMIDFWHRPGVFDQMPEPVKAYLLKETARNTRDVRATFGEEYSLSAFARLAVPILAVCGSRSPAVTRQIAKAIAAHAPMGSFASLEDADHALTTTHADAVAEAISNAAENAAHPPPATDAPRAARAGFGSR
jgi:pimeloyl-ACP methyl ester carboxylesterase